MQVQISDIKITDRQRREFGNIDEMANSLARFGLLHPIVLDESLNLIAGQRRLLAAMQLGWTHIEATQKDNLDELSKKELELEENIRRKDLSWPEQVRAVRDLFKMRQARYGGERAGVARSGSIVDQIADDQQYYSLDDLSEELDRAKSGTHFDIRLAEALDELPEIEREPTKNAAWQRYKSWRETRIREELAKRTVMPSESEHGSDDDSNGERSEEAIGQTKPHPAVRQPIRKVGWKGKGILYHADSRDVLRLLPSESVDAIVCDPPFALGMHKEGDTIGNKRLANSAGHMYDDDPHAIMDMLDEVFLNASRVLKPDGFVYCFFHMTRYEPIFLMLRQHFGNEIEPTPIVWIKNTPGIGDPGRSWVYAYEPCFFISRGGRRLVKPQAFNYLKYDTIPPSQKIHPTQKPAALLRHLIGASCVRGEVILDPFAGSASTLVAAYQVGCRFIGIEREEAFHRAATEALAEALSEEQASEDPKSNGENSYETAANLIHGETDG